MDAMVRICGARTKANGLPCQRVCAPGFNRCNLHGGHSPLARQAAQRALAAAALPAAQVLFDILDRYQSDTCPHCCMPRGDPTPVIRAAQIVLDRTGFHPSVSVELSRQEPQAAEWGPWMTDDQLRQIGQWIADAKRRMAAGEPPEDRMPQPVEPEDGVLIDDEPVDQQGSSPTGGEPNE